MSETEHELRPSPDEPETTPASEPDPHENDAVAEASEGSFPASDAPPWTSSATPGNGHPARHSGS